MQDELRAKAMEPPREPPPRTTVADYAERWLALQKIGPSTADHYLATLADRILPQLGHLDVATIGRRDVLAWCRWAEAQTKPDGSLYASATLDSWWRVLRPMLRDLAADHGTDDPTVRVRPPRSPVRGRRETRSIPADQIAALWEVIAERWPQWYVELAAFGLTGVRRGELCAWDVEDYYPVQRMLLVTRAVKRDGSIGPAKTEKGALWACPVSHSGPHPEDCACRGAGYVRGVPVVPELGRLLDAHLEALLGPKVEMLEELLGERGVRVLRTDGTALQRYRALCDAVRGAGVEVPEQPLFPSEDGGRRGYGSHYKVLRQAAKAAGIDVKVGTHTLRRTLNTRMLAADVPAQLVRGVLGHVTEEMTDHYAAPTVEDLAEAVGRGLGGKC